MAEKITDWPLIKRPVLVIPLSRYAKAELWITTHKCRAVTRKEIEHLQKNIAIWLKTQDEEKR